MLAKSATDPCRMLPLLPSGFLLLPLQHRLQVHHKVFSVWFPIQQAMNNPPAPGEYFDFRKHRSPQLEQPARAWGVLSVMKKSVRRLRTTRPRLGSTIFSPFCAETIRNNPPAPGEYIGACRFLCRLLPLGLQVSAGKHGGIEPRI